MLNQCPGAPVSRTNIYTHKLINNIAKKKKLINDINLSKLN